jgi:starch phosphorylase
MLTKPDATRPVVAYFTMEIALTPDRPFYAGGLGVLAGDAVRAAADLRLPLVAVSLLHREGYFEQSFSASGEQIEKPERPLIEQLLQSQEARVVVHVSNRKVVLRCWRYDVAAQSSLFGARSDHNRGSWDVPVFFLDADLPENAPEDRRITSRLYGGEHPDRLAQEVVLGIGGVRMLRALGYESPMVSCFHMNEGHAALLAAELIREGIEAGLSEQDAAMSIREKCVFTTHTPIAAGHDRFDGALAESMTGGVLRPSAVFFKDGMLDMTHTALQSSRFVNGVAIKHAEVCRRMFPGRQIEAVTNGVHPNTWVCPQLAAIYDKHCTGWRQDSQQLRLALGIGWQQFADVKCAAKELVLDRVFTHSGLRMRTEIFTIGIARRATGYKRIDLLLRNPDRLRAIAHATGGLQLVFAGKAHPKDGTGKEAIRRIHAAAAEMGEEIKIAYLPGYDMSLAAMLVAGVDLWLNTPIPPLEASGTSGMKAALNGVPSLSTMDGWWLEGCIEGITGWGIGEGERHGDPEGDRKDSDSLLDKLEHEILPLYRGNPEEWTRVGLQAVALNGPYFSSQRMMRDYNEKAYHVR